MTPLALEETYCQEEGCDGTLFNVTSRLEEALGRIVVKCDKCDKRWSMKVS